MIGIWAFIMLARSRTLNWYTLIMIPFIFVIGGSIASFVIGGIMGEYIIRTERNAGAYFNESRCCASICI